MFKRPLSPDKVNHQMKLKEQMADLERDPGYKDLIERLVDLNNVLLVYVILPNLFMVKGLRFPY